MEISTGWNFKFQFVKLNKQNIPRKTWAVKAFGFADMKGRNDED